MAPANPPRGKGRGTHRVQVQIGGETFWLKGDAPAAYMERLAGRVDAMLRAVLARDPSMPRYRAAILTAIHLAHELEGRNGRPPDESAAPGAPGTPPGGEDEA